MTDSNNDLEDEGYVDVTFMELAAAYRRQKVTNADLEERIIDLELQARKNQDRINLCTRDISELDGWVEDLEGTKADKEQLSDTQDQFFTDARQVKQRLAVIEDASGIDVEDQLRDDPVARLRREGPPKDTKTLHRAHWLLQAAPEHVGRVAKTTAGHELLITSAEAADFLSVYDDGKNSYESTEIRRIFNTITGLARGSVRRVTVGTGQSGRRTLKIAIREPIDEW